MVGSSWGYGGVMDFTEWLHDLKPSQWVMYGQAYGLESHQAGYLWGLTREEQHQDFRDWLEHIYEKQKETNK